ncbi:MULTISPECIES: LacI family DNA-binding transcriptional regulator [unclassified Sphingomonas]|uniref:LacI family DNA-binding transcriptional regulator n=1 Tax=unclassified Sphingomonas TaxID=196159 RepID=UPI002151B0C0|nr:MULTISPECIES: LacI family DNA-binding transcriptional regulator [unclassified Sphingomonas]MCR5870079.1 LacI family DNA-binding transcriptional regulator [Sphingomonas sp. J344]UUX98231.1 LacI family DNA-binding transcriptional regulator [Sphingomonas sp. J315]
MAPPASAKPRSSRRRGGAPTIADVAAEAQCSPMTVSRVINGEGNVRENTREQVLAAIAKLNFAPNRAARSLAGGEQLRIALMFDNPSASYLSEFLMGALEEASRADIHLVVQNCENVAEAKSLVHHLIDGGIKGFILPPPLCDDQSVLDLITDAGAVAIAVGPGKASGSHAAVLIDDFQAAYDMTRHIIDLGHNRIGFIIGNPEQVSSGRRLNGYKAALEAAGIPVREELIAQGRFTYRSGMQASERLISVDPRPTAIFASNDDMAAATVAVAHRLHLDVPNDITVCGFDDTAMASTIWPELTTVRQPIRGMTAWAVSAAVRILKAKRNGEPLEVEQKTLPYTLVRRDSDSAPTLARRAAPKRSPDA